MFLIIRTPKVLITFILSVRKAIFISESLSLCCWFVMRKLKGAFTGLFERSHEVFSVSLWFSGQVRTQRMHSNIQYVLGSVKFLLRDYYCRMFYEYLSEY